jgi:hypothetical protein
MLPGVDPPQRLVDAAERLRPPLKQREVERLLATRFRVITEVTHFGQSAGAHDTPSTLQIVTYLTPAVLQELPQFS